MTAAILKVGNSAQTSMHNFMSKLNKWMMVIGYARAAGELRRAGYHKAADECISQMRSL